MKEPTPIQETQYDAEKDEKDLEDLEEIRLAEKAEWETLRDYQASVL